MGQRVSLPMCLTGRACGKVRIRMPCGRYEEVVSPCVAWKVMGKHPEHLVVHCSLSRYGTVNISIISPNQDLLPGVPYMLYPKVDSTELSEEKGVSNIPGKMCLSLKNRQLTFPSSTSPNSRSKKSAQFETVPEEDFLITHNGEKSAQFETVPEEDLLITHNGEKSL